jgi:hypothetical protein
MVQRDGKLRRRSAGIAASAASKRMGMGKIVLLITAVCTLGAKLIDWWRTPKPTTLKVEDEKPDSEPVSADLPDRNG